ncbi:MAG TPA: AbiV family abortive infection protein [Pyrinomonadaceae bacterium]|nr:AbiV family abortive infection protein [Pyrinomonadaceae bacterium]
MRRHQKKERTRRPLPDRSNSARGALLSLTNARHHLRAAEILADERLFGSAASHVVLALEEMTKSWALTLLGMGVDLPKSMLAEVLSKHDVRHSIAFGILYTAMIQGLRVRAALRVQQRHRVKDFPPELRDEFVSELKMEFKSLASHSRKKNPLIILLELVGGANDMKKQGLYVDFDGERWTHPRSISQKRFNLGFEVVEGLIRELGRTIRKIHKTGVQADDSLKELLKSQLSKDPGSDPEQILITLTKVALHPG